MWIRVPSSLVLLELLISSPLTDTNTPVSGSVDNWSITYNYVIIF